MSSAGLEISGQTDPIPQQSVVVHRMTPRKVLSYDIGFRCVIDLASAKRNSFRNSSQCSELDSRIMAEWSTGSFMQLAHLIIDIVLVGSDGRW
jgi:hypothetical protein